MPVTKHDVGGRSVLLEYEGAEPTPAELALLATKMDVPAKPKPVFDTFKQTELGNAERLIARHGANIRYLAESPSVGTWYVWNGKRWAEDKAGLEINALMFNTIRELYEVAKAMSEDGDKDTQGVGAALHIWLGKSESAGRIASSIKLAQSLPGVAVRRDELDASPDLLNVQNGTLDLRTGELRPHDRADLLTRICPVAYIKGAAAPTWEKCLTTWQPEADVRTYLQRAAGYSLTGLTGEETAFLLLATGRNGKSKFVGALESCMGTVGSDGYAARISTAALMDARRGGAVTPDLVDLVGARLCIGSELEQGRSVNEALIKDLTGGDAITVNPKNRPVFRLETKCKFWIYGNHEPVIRGTDEGIWARLPRINFDTFIPVEERDVNLQAKLDAESEGVLAWMVAGAVEWYKTRLAAPASVLIASKEYRQSQDPFADFFGTVCEANKARTEDGAAGKAWFTPTSDLRLALRNLVGENEEKRITSQALGEKLRQVGAVAKTQRVNGTMVRGWAGVRLVDTTHDDSPELKQCNSETEDLYPARVSGPSCVADIQSSVSLLHCFNTDKDNKEEKTEEGVEADPFPPDANEPPLSAEDAAFLAELGAEGITDPFAGEELEPMPAREAGPVGPSAAVVVPRVVWGAETLPGKLTPGLPVFWGAHFKPCFGTGLSQSAALAALAADLENEPPEVRRLAAEPLRIERARLKVEGEPADAAAWLKERGV